jgi:MSHA biogenesis protein MshQ
MVPLVGDFRIRLPRWNLFKMRMARDSIEMAVRCPMRPLALAACLFPAAGVADVTLPGNQHIGDNGGDVVAGMMPGDPVTRQKILTYPSRFHLSDSITVTEVSVSGLVGLDGDALEVYIDGNLVGQGADGAATVGIGGTTLAAGEHSIAVRPLRCLTRGGQPKECDSPAAREGNDIGFSGITLISGGTQYSQNWVQRRHIGDNEDQTCFLFFCFDSNDWYDRDSGDEPWYYSGDEPWYYPDSPEGSSVSLGFNVAAATRFEEIRVFAARQLDSGAEIFLDGVSVGTLTAAGQGVYDVTIDMADTVLQPGDNPHTLRLDSTDAGGGDLDDISWDSISLVGAPAAGLDHIRLLHDGQGITCAPETITVQACGNSNCSELYTDPVEVDLTSPDGGWSADPVVVDNGSTTVDLRFTTPGTAVLDAVATNPMATTATRCFVDATETCDLEFAEAGFIFDVPDQTACRPSAPVTISAVKTNPEDGTTCAPAFTGKRDVAFWSDYLDPAGGTRAVAVNGTGVAGASPGTPITLTFDGNAQATFTVRYPDAGRMSLTAQYQGSGDQAGLVLTGTDAFVSRPAGLVVYSQAANADCPSDDATCSVIGAAGDPFDLTVKAACWESDSDTDLSDNPATPNFEMAGIDVNHALVAPAGGTPGDIGVSSVDMTAADDGVTTRAQSVSEVGVFTFSVDPPDYFGQALNAVTSPGIGRFTPARLEVSANTPAFAPFCSGFTYAGQPFYFDVGLAPAFTVTARNTAGQVTANYGGAFWKLDSILANRAYGDAAASADGIATTLDPDGAALIGAEDFDGQGQLILDDGGAGDRIEYLRDDANPVEPFDARVDLRLPAGDLADSDGICFDPDGDGSCNKFVVEEITGTELRYGRLVLDNAHGPQSDPLDVPVRSEYFLGGEFVPNQVDSCTVLPDAANVILSDWTESLASGETQVDGVTGLTDGQDAIQLTAPGTSDTDSNDGSVRVTLEALDDWLLTDENGDGTYAEFPAARASFGMYRGDDRFIFWQEAR